MFQIYRSFTLTTTINWGRMTHICISNLTIFGSDNGLSPGRRQAIIQTTAGILLIGPLGTNCIGFEIKIHIFFLQENIFENFVWKMTTMLSRSGCVNHHAIALIQSLLFAIATIAIDDKPAKHMLSSNLAKSRHKFMKRTLQQYGRALCKISKVLCNCEISWKLI